MSSKSRETSVPQAVAAAAVAAAALAFLHQRFLRSRSTVRRLSNLQSPVPADIVIAQSTEPQHIARIARGAGVLESELEQYGPKKAKVRALLSFVNVNYGVHGLPATPVRFCTFFTVFMVYELLAAESYCRLSYGYVSGNHSSS